MKCQYILTLLLPNKTSSTGDFMKKVPTPTLSDRQIVSIGREYTPKYLLYKSAVQCMPRIGFENFRTAVCVLRDKQISSLSADQLSAISVYIVTLSADLACSTKKAIFIVRHPAPPSSEKTAMVSLQVPVSNSTANDITSM